MSIVKLPDDAKDARGPIDGNFAYLQTRICDLCVNVKDYGAKGDGNTDDTAALQAAIDDVSANGGGTLFLPAGTYKLTAALTISDTALGNISIVGAGRNFGGTVLRPTGCAGFNIDGTNATGGWKFRIRIANLMIWPTGAWTGHLVTLNLCYNVVLDNLWLYEIPVGNDGVYVTNSNDIVLRDLIVYGAEANDNRGIWVGDSSTVQIHNPDVENCSRGIRCAGECNVTITAPYVERCVIALDVQTALAAGASSVAVLGGVLSSVNGYCVGLAGSNLTMVGTALQPYEGPDPGGWGVVCETVNPKNCLFLNVPENAAGKIWGYSGNVLENITRIPAPA